MKLEWHDDGTVVWAQSVCHDDGANFVYELHERPDGTWSNQSEAELRMPDAPDYFDTLEAAKAWAEQTEKGWVAAAA